MLLAYSAISVVSICLLANIFFNYYMDNEIQNELKIHSEVIYNIEKRFEEQNNISNSLINGINTQRKITDELSVLINKSYEEYLNYKLDNFYRNNSKQVDFNYLLETILSNRKDVLAVVVNNKDKKPVNEIVLNHDKWYKIKNTNKDINQIRKISKPIKNIDLLYTLGYIDIYFDLSYINSILKKSNLNGYLGIVDNNNEMIFDCSEYISKNREKLDNIVSWNNDKGKNKNIITNIREDAQSKFKYISIIPRDELDSSNVRIKTLFISILFIISIITVTYVVIHNHSIKLKRIMNGLKKIQYGDLEARFNIEKEDDELDTIAIGINQMCDSLQDSIEKNYISEVNQKQAEINALQAQIKPHFLYNTLEVIRMCALTSKNTEVAQMIYSLGSMFRYSTYNNGNVVKLKEEIKYSKMYLDLCCTRYRGIFDYKLDVEDELLDCIIPKFILQPIVENSVSHGIRKECNENHIKIDIVKNESDLEIKVEDNGVGIDEEGLKNITENLKKNLQKPNSIGLMNINNRLKLKFGDDYGITIASEKNKYTVVKCRIPMLRDEGEYV